MTDRYDVIGHDEHGIPKLRYCLDPREVTVIRDPERDGEVIGYIWEPVGPVPQPIRTDPPPRLTAAEIEDLKQRFLAAQRKPQRWYPPREGGYTAAPHTGHADTGPPPPPPGAGGVGTPRRRRWWRR